MVWVTKWARRGLCLQRCDPEVGPREKLREGKRHLRWVDGWSTGEEDDPTLAAVHVTNPRFAFLSKPTPSPRSDTPWGRPPPALATMLDKQVGGPVRPEEPLRAPLGRTGPPRSPWATEC